MTRGKTQLFGVALILIALTICAGTFRSLYRGESNESQFKVPGRGLNSQSAGPVE